MNRSVVLSAAVTAILLVAGAVAIYLLLEDSAGPGQRRAADSFPAADDVPEEDVEVASAPGSVSPETSGDAAGVDAASAIATPPAGPVSIHGRVIDSGFGGISGARIVALNLQHWSALIEERRDELASSDDPIGMIRRVRAVLSTSAGQVARTESGEDGAYAFHGLAEGDYRLFTTHAAYLPDDQTWAVVERDRTQRVDIELLPGTFIAGRVVDGSARPIAGATITAVPAYRGASKGIAKMLEAFSAIFEGHMLVEELTHRSTADGGFRLGPLEPAAHDITVKGEGFVAARAYRVPPGAEDVVIVVEPGLEIAGTLLGPDSRPIAGASWTLMPALRTDITSDPLALVQRDFDVLGESTRRGSTAAAGRLEIGGVEAGSYVLRFETGEHPVLELAIEARDRRTELGEVVLEESLAISGRVTDSTGAPAPGARVWIATDVGGLFTRPGQSTEVLAETTAGERGEFRLVRLAPGRYRVQATAPGSARGQRDEVQAGSRSVTIQLGDGATLAGRVLDGRDRSPVAGAHLMVLGGGRELGETDADGYFEIRGVGTPAAGTAAAEALSAGFQVQITHPEYSTVYQQLSPSTGADAPVPEVLLTPAQRVRGVVLDRAGDPVRNARVRVVVPGIPEFLLMFSPGRSPGRVFSAADGAFSVAVPEAMGPTGSGMEIVASHPAYADGRVALGDIGRGSEAPGDVRIVVSEGSSIGGRVLTPGGQPVVGAQVRVSRPVRLAGETLIVAAVMPEQAGKVAYSKTDGSYEVRAVEEGEYTLEVSAPGYAKKVIESVVVTGEGVTQDVLLDAGGSITGVVVDTGGEPVAGVEVVAFLDLQELSEDGNDRMALEMIRFTGRGTSMARTDAGGRYSVRQLPDGEYTLVARAPGFLPAERVGVAPGEEAPELVLRRFASLRVTVLDGASRNPVPEYRIQVERQETEDDPDPFGYQPIQNVSDERGQFTREDLRPGRYDVGVRAKGFTPYFGEVTITEGEAAELVARLIPGLACSVVVTDAEGGAPIAGVIVNLMRQQRDERTERLSRLGLIDSYPSDADGMVVLDSLTEGKYQVSVSHSDYFPADDNRFTVELPADEGRELNIRMRLGGRLRGTLTGLESVDPGEVGYQLMLTRHQDAPAEPGAAAKSPGEERRRRGGNVEWVGVDLHGGGTFERDGLRPGTYEVTLRKYVYTVEDGRRRSAQGEEPVPLGSVVIEPGATRTASFSVPE